MTIAPLDVAIATTDVTVGTPYACVKGQIAPAGVQYVPAGPFQAPKLGQLVAVAARKAPEMGA